jgi:hypothetical protein
MTFGKGGRYNQFILIYSERRRTMRNLINVLICLSALGFVLAVISAFAGRIAGITPEGFSQGCTNLALIAIALSVCCPSKEDDKGGEE